MANWSNPVLTSTYTDFMNQLKDRDVDLALQFDGASSSNIPTNAIRWSSSANRWQKWSGSAWDELTTTYALTGLSTTGNASIGGTLTVTGSTTLASATATTPTASDDSTKVATTAFVKDQLYAPLASPTFTGTPAAPTAAVGTNTTQLATTAYVNAEIANDALLKSGGTMTGAITLSGDPTADLHAVPRQWVEGRASKESCRVATTAELNATSTVNTLTNSGTLAAISIDGIALSVGDRVLVKNQSTASQNGIYAVTNAGSASVAWILTRASDADTWNDLVGAYTAIEQGTSNDDTFWICEIARGGTLGTTSITWQLGANQQTASFAALATNGLITRTATNTIAARSLAVSGTGISVSNADGVSGNPTVTSNATSANTASTIVARDSSGNFSAGTIALISFSYSGNPSSSSTGAFELPTGTTAQRPTPTAGHVRFNSSSEQFEGYTGATWANLGATAITNRIINGAMAIDQRNAGASQTFTNGAAFAYSVDRWYGYCSGANVTGQRVQGATAGQFRYRFTGAASVTAIGFGQRIEQINSADLAGTTATLSVDLANSVLTTVTWTAYYANTANTFGTRASPTRTQISTGAFTVNSTVTRYDTQISIPSAATTGIEIVFTVGAQTSGTWTIGDVQLERGGVATPIERRSYGLELDLCQRYYEKSYAQGSVPGSIGRAGSWFGVAINGGDFYSLGGVSFRAIKRAGPSVTAYSPGTGQAGVLYNTSVATDQGNAGIDDIADSGFRFFCSNNAMTFNHGFTVHWTASSEL